MIMMYRTNHPRSGMVTLFWIFCPMVTRAILNIVQSIKAFKDRKITLLKCGCGEMKVDM